MGLQHGAHSLGENIRELREQRHWTQSNLAKALNLTRASINAWEMGISTPSTRYIVSLAQLFHVSTDFLLGMTSPRSIDVSDLADEDILMVAKVAQHLREIRKEQSG